MEMHSPAHPGEVLKEFYLPTGLSVGEAAKRLGVSRQALSAILNRPRRH
jgi:addiction module HigA family antidote